MWGAQRYCRSRGSGPAVDPQLYASDHKHLSVGDTGYPSGNGFPTVTGNVVFDLARNPSTGHAILVEPRDDEGAAESEPSPG